MSTSSDNTWYTGDWESHNHIKEPYNGVKIKAAASYEPETSPPSQRNLVSVQLDVVDFTKDPNGVSSIVMLYKTGVWYDIPIPEDDTSSPPVPNAKFTVTNIDLDGLGQVQLTKTTTGIFLQVLFRYGLEHRTREELGFIMEISQTYVEGKTPIIVSG